jgi:hypothetical protein
MVEETGKAVLWAGIDVGWGAGAVAEGSGAAIDSGNSANAKSTAVGQTNSRNCLCRITSARKWETDARRRKEFGQFIGLLSGSRHRQCGTFGVDPTSIQHHHENAIALEWGDEYSVRVACGCGSPGLSPMSRPSARYGRSLSRATTGLKNRPLVPARGHTGEGYEGS